MVDFQQLNALFTPVISPPGVNDKDSPFILILQISSSSKQALSPNQVKAYGI